MQFISGWFFYFLFYVGKEIMQIELYKVSENNNNNNILILKNSMT